jgi:hypothetical protein
MLRSLPWVIAFVLVIGAGVVQGLHTDRWVVSQELTDAAMKLDDIPDEIGTWKQAGKDQEMEPSQKELAEIVNYKMRTYRDSVSRSTVNVLIMCGRPGPIAVHTPDVCFLGDGYEMSEMPKRVTPVDGMHAQFMTAHFRIPDQVSKPGLRVYWAWSTDGNWTAPENTRWTFASNRALFKMYVMWEQLSDEKPKDVPQLKFLKALLEKLHEKLSPVP